MQNNELTLQKKFASKIAELANPAESSILANWCEQLLKIREMNLSPAKKAQAAYAATAKAKVIIPIIKKVSAEMKKHAWDDRSKKSRIGLSVAGISLVAFGGQSAGIAALGGAIGVPLWIVFGAGTTFATQIIEDLTEKRKSTREEFTTTHNEKAKIIEAAYEIINR